MLRLSVNRLVSGLTNRFSLRVNQTISDFVVTRSCQSAPENLLAPHHETNQRNVHSKRARTIISQAFDSVSSKLKLPSIKPVYSTVPVHTKGSSMWRTVLTLKWPENLSFEAVGRNKKESEELVAQQALSMLQESKVISSKGKLICELNPHKTLQSSDKTSLPLPADEGPLPLAAEGSMNKDALRIIEENYPQYKTTLLNCYIKVSNHMKDANFIVRPTFKRIEGKTACWQASYHLKWPEIKEFSGIGTTRAVAEKWAILSTLHWLLEHKHLHPDGYPNLYSEDEFQKWKNDSKSPAPVNISSKLLDELEGLVNEFKSLKPLIDESRSVFTEETGTKSLIPEDREAEELDSVDMEHALKDISETSENEVKFSENDDTSVDPITGRRVRELGSGELQNRCDELFVSAKERIIDKSGFQVPHLPIVEKREEILDLVERNRVIVLSGDTGCGKSTQMPQYLLDSFALKNRGTECNIIVTQPRRLAALSLAQTVASHRGEKVGESVGYQVRLNSVLPRKSKGRILFCSTGILLRRIQTCPDLSGVSHLIIDEVHERDCLTDFTLVIIKDLLQINPNLKVILMSASLNADLLSRYFGSAPMVHVNGRTFPVKQSYLPDILNLTRSFGESRNNVDKPIVDQNLVVNLIRYLDFNKPTQGSILCFLPGWAEIKSLHSRLKEFYPSEETHWVLPVHSRLSQTEQERIFDRPPEGVRKIVLATNIAETSLTINDCVYVIDPGVHKEMRYNSQRGSAIMENQWISKANVQQRAGRAGRVQPGESYHLYPLEKYKEMDQFPQAEMLRIPLEKVVMDIKAYDENLKSTEFLSRTLEPPSLRSIEDAILELESIDALDSNERLTPLGRRIAQFSSHPRLSKSLVYATLFRCLDPVASIVAGLSSAREGWSVDSTINNQRQVIRQAKHRFHPTSDHLALSNLMRHFCEQRGRYQVDEFCYDVKANPKALYFLKGVKKLLVDHVRDSDLLDGSSDTDSFNHPVNRNAHNEAMVKAALLMGFGDRVLRVRRGRMIKGVIKQKDLVILSEKHGLVHLAPDSVNAEGLIQSDFLIFFNGVFSTERKALVVRDTTQVPNLVPLISAGKMLAVRKARDFDDATNEMQTVLSVDRRNHLSFKCSSREAELLTALRSNLADTCDYLLRSTGLRNDHFSSDIRMFHDRQVDFLAKLLSSNGSRN